MASHRACCAEGKTSCKRCGVSVAKIRQSVRFGKTFQPIETTALPTPQMPCVLRELNPEILLCYTNSRRTDAVPCQTWPVTRTGLAKTREQESDQEASEALDEARFN
jgi:hypothetical protein